MKKTITILAIIVMLLTLSVMFTACGDKCEHSYFSDCDEICDKCGEEREATAEHNYYGDCDISCHSCGKKRETTAEHSWKDATCTTPEGCEVCGAFIGEPKGHTPAEDDGDCTTEIKCTVCGYVITAARDEHTQVEDDGDCTTAITCSVCGTVTTPARDNHTGGTATCLGYQCDICEVWYGDKNPDNHASEEFTYTANEDGTTHKKSHKCCVTAAVESENHIYDETGECVCGEKAMLVSTAEQLLAAIGKGGKIALVTDIDASSLNKIEIANDVQLNLNGNNISNLEELYVVDGANLAILSQGQLQAFNFIVDGGDVYIANSKIYAEIQSENETSVLNIKNGYIELVTDFVGTVNATGSTIDYLDFANGMVTLYDCTLSTAQIETSTCVITDSNISNTINIVSTNGTITNATVGAITVTGKALVNLSNIQTDSLIVTNNEELCVDGNETSIAVVELLSNGNCTIKGGDVEEIRLYSGTFILDGGRVKYLETFDNDTTCNIYDGYLSSIIFTDYIDCITGGTFGFDPTIKVDTQLYILTENGDGTWTVEPLSD